jgi:predicted nuclease of predicted toxin-antitoxin system
VKFLIDECLHTSLVDVAEQHGHECQHVNWLGLSGQSDWNLVPRIVDGNYTFVTNNAGDFRRLYARRELHAGLVIIVQQVVPARQRTLFSTLLDTLQPGDVLINEVIEITLDAGEAVFTRYDLAQADEDGL